MASMNYNRTRNLFSVCDEFNPQRSSKWNLKLVALHGEEDKSSLFAVTTCEILN